MTPATRSAVSPARSQPASQEDPDRGPRRHEKAFAARRDQVREARRFFAGLLDGCPAADDVLLVASEMAANSVLHSASGQPGGTFTITAGIRPGDYVRIEVRDQGGPWNQRHHHDDRPHGLDIIASFAASHGVSGDPLTGWTAWAVLAWHPAPRTEPPSPNGHPDDHHG